MIMITQLAAAAEAAALLVFERERAAPMGDSPIADWTKHVYVPAFGQGGEFF